MGQHGDLRRRADEHKLKYKSFNVDKFMEWVLSHSPVWQEREIKYTIQYLNQSRRWETYQVIQYYKTRDQVVRDPGTED